MTDTVYIIGKAAEKYSVAAFKDGEKMPGAVYIVNKKGVCDCPGYRWQKDKTQHKHTKLVKFWTEHLEEQDGFAMWFDGDDIEYRKFI